MKEERKAVSLPADLYSRVEERAKSSGFDSVDDYVIFVLEELIRPDEGEQDLTLSEEEDAEIRNRLRALGYFD